MKTLKKILEVAGCTAPFDKPLSRQKLMEACRRAGADPEFLERVFSVQDALATLLVSKDLAYGGYEEACEPSLKNHDAARCYFDVRRKYVRLKELTWGVNKTKEGLVDTYADLANYGMLGVLTQARQDGVTQTPRGTKRKAGSSGGRAPTSRRRSKTSAGRSKRSKTKRSRHSSEEGHAWGR